MRFAKMGRSTLLGATLLILPASGQTMAGSGAGVAPCGFTALTCMNSLAFNNAGAPLGAINAPSGAPAIGNQAAVTAISPVPNSGFSPAGTALTSSPTSFGNPNLVTPAPSGLLAVSPGLAATSTMSGQIAFMPGPLGANSLSPASSALAMTTTPTGTTMSPAFGVGSSSANASGFGSTSSGFATSMPSPTAFASTSAMGGTAVTSPAIGAPSQQGTLAAPGH